MMMKRLSVKVVKTKSSPDENDLHFFVPNVNFEFFGKAIDFLGRGAQNKSGKVAVK